MTIHKVFMGIWVLLILWNIFASIAFTMSGEPAKAKKNLFWTFMGILMLGMLWVMKPLVARDKNPKSTGTNVVAESTATNMMVPDTVTSVSTAGSAPSKAATEETRAAPEIAAEPEASPEKKRLPKYVVVMALIGAVLGSILGFRRAMKEHA